MLILGRVWLLFVLSFAIVWAAQVESTVDRQEIVSGESVTLQITAKGDKVAFPNIQEINGMKVTDAGTSRQSAVSVTFNGIKSEVSTVKRYRFEPTRDMTIPAYTVNISGKQYRTQPIRIKVLKNNAQPSTQFSFALSTNKKSVYVGESFIATIAMTISNTLTGIQISDYIAPTAKEFFIKEIPGQKEYQRNGYSVIEKKYILTTKKEGNYTISPATARFGEPDMRRQDIFGRYAMRWRTITSNALTVEVKAQTNDADLIGEFSLDSKIDTQSVQANKPVNLTIKIKGKGSLEDFEFPQYDIDGVTIYSDKAKVQSDLVNDTLVSNYTKSFAFISEKSFVIPSRSISMYNPQTKEKKTLKIPQYKIEIKGKNAVVTTSSEKNESKQEVQNVQTKVEAKKEKKENTLSWWMLVVAFILGLCMMYLWRYIPSIVQKQTRAYKEHEALQTLYAHIGEDATVEEMVRKLYARKNGDKSIQIDKKELHEMLERFR
ncbi:MAG: hypothetical protein DSZ08_00140 [Sulfurovum sp.]|nr:MAG: hypothetical protein DSZ08_00140 [Sulfurovum sp.]